jgi:ATP-binding cassette subfamily F protein uup
VGLAHSLIERPDLLILDEPTNHLDAETVEWLEGYLARWRGALLLVTHDRYFLDRVTSRIVELDERRLWSYAGSYGYYLEKKEEETERRGVEARKRAALIRQERAWLLKGARARTTKQKARVERADELISRPKEAQRAAIQLETASTRLGSRVLELAGATKGYDGRVLIDDFTYIVPPGERLGIIGPNGSGKTTLLEMIAGRVQPDSGRVEIGQTVVVGYFDQESQLPNEDQRVVDVVRDVAEHVFTGDGRTITAAQMLERFLFTGAMQHSSVSRLSGGERRRLCLLRVLMAAPNLLLLDEPTNDLDIATLMALEDYLDAFKGSVIVASHDRYFLDRTAAHLLRMEGNGRIREYPGNYSTFLEIRERERAMETPAPRATGERAPSIAHEGTSDENDAKARLSFKERKELSGLELTIAALESRKTGIERALGDPATDFRDTAALSAELRDVESELSGAMDRWAELAERA